MRILGVDPGTIRTGVGLIEIKGSTPQLLEANTLHASREKDRIKRLYFIYQELRATLQRTRPDVMALENIFYGKDPKAMVRIGEARACAMLAASEFGIEVREYSPGEVKQAVTGNGQATKDQIQKMIRQLFKVQGVLGPDSADAAAVALCHHHRGKGFSRGRKSKSGSGWTMEDINRLKGKAPLVARGLSPYKGKVYV